MGKFNDTLNAYGLTNWHLQAGIWYDYEEHRQLRELINQGALTSQMTTNCISRFINILWSAGREKVGVYGGYKKNKILIAVITVATIYCVSK